jgi:hypothetical protein
VCRSGAAHINGAHAKAYDSRTSFRSTLVFQSGALSARPFAILRRDSRHFQAEAAWPSLCCYRACRNGNVGGSLTSPSGPQESVTGHGPPGLFRRMRRHRSTTSNKVRTVPALPPYTPWSGNPVTPIVRGAARCGFPNNEALSFACRSLSNHEPCGQGGRHVRTCIDVNANTLSGQLSICERPGIQSARISPAMSLAVRSRSHSACI